MRRAISKLSMLNEGIYAQGKYRVTSSMMTCLMMKS